MTHVLVLYNIFLLSSYIIICYLTLEPPVAVVVLDSDHHLFRDQDRRYHLYRTIKVIAIIVIEVC